MEVSIFPDYSVRDLKAGFVEARLNSDAHDLEQRARIAGLIETLAESTAQPIYVSVDPRTEEEMARFSGAVLSSAYPFRFFLETMKAELELPPGAWKTAQAAAPESEG